MYTQNYQYIQATQPIFQAVILPILLLTLRDYFPSFSELSGGFK